MRESSTYQAVLEEGRVEGRVEGRTEGAVAEAKKMLRLLAEDAFGSPDARTAKIVDELEDLSRLEELAKRVRLTTSWEELLARPAAPRRQKRRDSR